MNKLSGMAPELAPWVQFTLDVAAYYYGLKPTLTSTSRTDQEQAKLYAEYLAGRSKYPAAPPGRSCHNNALGSLCWDSTVPADKQDLWDAIRRAVGWEVLPDDRIHAQYPGWRSLLPG